MLSGLMSGVLMALDTVILGIIMGMPAYMASETGAALAPFISSFFHCAFSALWVWGYLKARKQSRGVIRALRSRGGRLVAVSALVGGPVGMISYTAAIHYIGPSYTAAISALYPAVGALFSHLFLKEKMSWIQAAGLSVSMVAVLILGFSSGEAPASHMPLGFALAFLACVSWASEAVIFSCGFRQSEITEPQALLIRQILSTLVCGLIFLPVLHGWMSTVSIFSDVSTLYNSLGALFITGSYLLYYTAINKLGPTKGTSLNITYTAWTIVFSLILMHEVPDMRSVICSLFIIIGSLTAATGRLPVRSLGNRKLE